MHILGALACISILIVIIVVAIAKAIVESSSHVEVRPKQLRGSVPGSDEIVKKPLAVEPAESEPSTTLASPPPSLPEKPAESHLRPPRLNEFIGQSSIKENLRVYIKAAVKRREALDHVLLTGPPGLGKTTLAHIIANEMGAHLYSTTGSEIQKLGDFAALFTNLQEGDVCFIRNIHLLPENFKEKLYQVMKDFVLEIRIGIGPGARDVKLDLPKFTLVTATMRPTLILASLRECFGINFHLDFYQREDLETICKRSAAILNVEIDDGGVHEIARRSRGTPHIVNILLRRVCDFAEVDYEGRITLDVARDALNRMEVDTYGLDEMDRKLLLTIIEKFEGGPVGVGTLSAAIHEEKDSIEELIEPYLIQIGFLNRTPRGRMATQLAYQHFGIRTGPQRPSLFD